MQGFLDAKRATNIGITLCIEGFLRSRWSVEMTAVGGRFPTTGISRTNILTVNYL